MDSIIFLSVMKSHRSYALVIGLLVLLNIVVPLASNASAIVTEEDRNALAARVDGQQLRSTALDIVNISESYPAFRVAGSRGANQTADFILSKFEDMGHMGPYG
jgi:hypothetical protein